MGVHQFGEGERQIQQRRDVELTACGCNELLVARRVRYNVSCSVINSRVRGDEMVFQ